MSYSTKKEFIQHVLSLLSEQCPDISVDFHTGSQLDEENPIVSLEQIWSESCRGKGRGRAAMTLICETADAFRVSITLTASPLLYDLDNENYSEDEQARLYTLNQQALSLDALVDWYRGFGFVCTELPSERGEPVMMKRDFLL